MIQADCGVPTSMYLVDRLRERSEAEKYNRRRTDQGDAGRRNCDLLMKHSSLKGAKR